MTRHGIWLSLRMYAIWKINIQTNWWIMKGFRANGSSRLRCCPLELLTADWRLKLSTIARSVWERESRTIYFKAKSSLKLAKWIPSRVTRSYVRTVAYRYRYWSQFYRCFVVCITTSTNIAVLIKKKKGEIFHLGEHIEQILPPRVVYLHLRHKREPFDSPSTPQTMPISLRRQ